MINFILKWVSSWMRLFEGIVGVTTIGIIRLNLALPVITYRLRRFHRIKSEKLRSKNERL